MPRSGQKRMKKPSLRQTARILGISAAYLSLLTAGKREWPQKLKQRYEEFVNIFVNTIDGGTKEEVTKAARVDRGNNIGGAAGTRTPYLFNAIEALSLMSYSPTKTVQVPGDTCTNITKQPLASNRLLALSDELYHRAAARVGVRRLHHVDILVGVQGHAVAGAIDLRAPAGQPLPFQRQDTD